MTEARTRPDDSAFRSWFRGCLREIPGNNVEWPSLVRRIFAEELKRLRDSDQYYDGQVFKNRDRKVAEHRHRDSEHEEVLVYRLYAAVHEHYHGVLQIGDMPVWLFSCEVPNQGKELSNRTKKRRADLLGLRQDGSLVVFECKGPQNRHDSPLYGLLEGLDYLGCLLTRRNLASLSDDLQDWLGNTASQEQQFSSVFPEDWTLEIEPQACHGVVVLAPKSYYDLHLVDATMQPEDWWLLSERRSLLVNATNLGSFSILLSWIMDRALRNGLSLRRLRLRLKCAPFSRTPLSTRSCHCRET